MLELFAENPAMFFLFVGLSGVAFRDLRWAAGLVVLFAWLQFVAA